MATNIVSLMNSFKSFLQNNQESFTNGLLILFTVAGEQIFKFTAFDCPCTRPEARIYACSFVFGPAAVLFVVGLMINNLAWRLWHGCVRRSGDSSHTCCEGIAHFLTVCARACTVSGAWLFTTLLDGKYYVCMMSKEPCVAVKDSEENKYLFAKSQWISWFFLTGLVIFVSIVICCIRCMDSATYMQNKYMNIYREKEEKHLEDNMKKSADTLAEKNAGVFMDHPCSKQDWDAISKAPHNGVEKDPSNNTLKPELSPLHKWCQKHSINTDRNQAPQIRVETRGHQQTASV